MQLRQTTSSFLAALRSPEVKKSAELAAAIGIVALAASPVFAGTDTTFNTAATTLTSWTNGSLGKMAAIAAVAVGVVSTIVRFDWRILAGSVGIGLAASAGPGIASSLVSATF